MPVGSRVLMPLAAVAALALVACQPLGQGGGATPGGDGASPAPGGTPGDSPAGSPADSPAAPGTQRLTIATGGTGGVYFPLGGGLAQELSENIEGVTATAQETSASVDNMLLIGSGDADIAFVLGDTAADAVEGRADFEGSPVDACTLGILYSNFTQVVTTTGTGIETIEDLRGKRVSVGAPGSGTEVIALRVLEAAGIDPEADLGARSQLLIDETVDALRDGTIDAGFWSGGLPTGALLDLPNLKLIPTAEFAAGLASEFGPFYLDKEIPANTYEGQDEPVPTVVVPNVLVVNKSMSEDLQRQITEVVFEQKDDLVQVHAAAGELDPATAGNVEFMEVCPGAQAYYDEAG
ncbi:MAG: TAXI family TRAP transporter solute-binding subunit [Chloroflexota bacterium]|nr:TAXI family TRAP transporter solute-binding subunit [Chloroflexota bacterium]